MNKNEQNLFQSVNINKIIIFHIKKQKIRHFPLPYASSRDESRASFRGHWSKNNSHSHSAYDCSYHT